MHHTIFKIIFAYIDIDKYKYLGIFLITCVIHNANIRDFWNDELSVNFRKKMQLNNFENLSNKALSNLHFIHNVKQLPRDEPVYDKLY